VRPTVRPTTRPTTKPTAKPTATPSPKPTPQPTAQPQVVYIGFQYLPDSTDFGKVAYYSPRKNATEADEVVVKTGSKIVFKNVNDNGLVPHTASGLGTTGFPTLFTNTSGQTRAGNVIDGSLTWSTGRLFQGTFSQVFTVGPPGVYYFGCAYHYVKAGMRDVIESTK
jgi:plastocyanin